MKKAMRLAAVIGSVVAVSLLAVSVVRAGAALLPAGKTTGPALTATVVIDVTDGNSCAADPSPTPRGVSSVRVQKASASTAAVFCSSYAASLVNMCVGDVKTNVAIQFTGLLDGFVDTPDVLSALVGQFGIPANSAITDQDYAACTTVGDRKYLSFTAVIQFKQ